MGQVRKPMAGDIYRHFKDRLYEIITIAIHSETEEEMVVYRQMYGTFETYVRPLSMFLSEVDHEKYPDVKQKYRFERIGALKQEEEEEPVKKIPTEFQREESKETVALKIPESKAVEKTEAVRKAVETVTTTAAETVSETVEDTDFEMDERMRLLMCFLDARTYGEKLRILEDVTGELDDRTINNMAISMDLVIEEGTPEDRLSELRECIRTKAKYEYFRLH